MPNILNVIVLIDGNEISQAHKTAHVHISSTTSWLQLQGDGLELLFKGTDAVLGSRLGALQVVKVGLKILELAGNLVLQTEQNLLKTNMESLIVIVPGWQALK